MAGSDARRRRRRLTALAVALLAAAGGLALVAGQRGGESAHPRPAAGPEGGGVDRPAPASGVLGSAALRGAGGRLWWSENRTCRLGVLDTKSLHRRYASGSHCRVWPAPDGRRALATLGDPALLLVERRLVVLRAAPGRAPTAAGLLAHQAGYLAAPLAWAPTGRRVALCLHTLDGDRIAAGPAVAGRVPLLRFGCNPAYEGGLVRAVGPLLRRNGRRLLDVRRAVPGARVISAVAARRGVLAVAVARSRAGRPVAPASVLLLTTSGRVRARLALPGGAPASELVLAPDGTAVAAFQPAVLQVALLSVPGGRALPRTAPRSARWAAWSPDGSSLALALEDGVHVYRRDGRQALIAGLRVHDLSWTR